MFKFFSKEKSKIINEIPFQKLNKIGEGKYSEVKIPINDPDIIVKAIRTKWKRGEEGVHPLNDPDRMKKDLDILEKNFGKYIPNTQLVIGKNELGEKTVYTIQERIYGSNLDNLKYDEHIAEQLKSFLNQVIDSYINNLAYHKNDNRPRSVFPDLKGNNFIFGKNKKRNDKNDKLYFIDSYPIQESHVQDFIEVYIPTVQNGFSQEWQKLINEFKKEATDKIINYLDKNENKIKRILINN